MNAVVVGGGIIGTSVALELARRGLAVEVLDDGRLEGAATLAAAGMLAPISEAQIEEPLVLELALDSLERFPAFVRELEALTGQDCGYRTDGTLWVAIHRDDVGELQHLEDTVGARLGRGAVRRMTAAEVLEREPHVSGRVLEGLWVERDLQVDPRALASALRSGARALGATIRREVRVTEILASGSRVSAVEAVGPDGPFRRTCDVVVLAAGAWSTSGIRSPHAGPAIRPIKGQLLRLRGVPLLRHVVRHPEVYLVPRGDGELLVGATMEEVGFDPSPTAGAVYDLLRRGRVLVPGLYDLALAEVSVGFRPVSRDSRPAIGPTSIAGLYVATGHGRQGVLLAPSTAHHLAECIAGGRVPDVLGPFCGGTPTEVEVTR
jgi:glycine oxidase